MVLVQGFLHFLSLWTTVKLQLVHFLYEEAVTYQRGGVCSLFCHHGSALLDQLYHLQEETSWMRINTSFTTPDSYNRVSSRISAPLDLNMLTKSRTGHRFIVIWDPLLSWSEALMTASGYLCKARRRARVKARCWRMELVTRKIS